MDTGTDGLRYDASLAYGSAGSPTITHTNQGTPGMVDYAVHYHHATWDEASSSQVA